MARCTWEFRRHAVRLGVSASLLAGTLGISALPASADQLSSLKAQAQGVAKQITTLGNRVESLSEQYDQGNLTLAKDRKAVAAATQAVTAANAATAKARSVLTKEAVNAYVNDASGGASAPAGNTLKDANNDILRAEYASSLAANETDAKDAYQLASDKARAAKQNLQAAQATAAKQVTTIAASRSQAMASESKLNDVYRDESKQIAKLVAQVQAQQEAAAAAAAQARAAAELQAQQEAAAAAAATSTTEAPTTDAPTTEAPTTDPPAPVPAPTDATTTTAPTTTVPATTTTTAAPVASSSGVGAAAVAAAETQVGVPYEIAGDTPRSAGDPGGFDCSGLVMWAYAQVGISLPHYSGAQFDAGVQISMSDLEPGDLVFFSDPGQHVAMYVGGGDIIEAPTEGQTVHIVPMYSEFVQAVRIT